MINEKECARIKNVILLDYKSKETLWNEQEIERYEIELILTTYRIILKIKEEDVNEINITLGSIAEIETISSGILGEVNEICIKCKDIRMINIEFKKEEEKVGFIWLLREIEQDRYITASDGSKLTFTIYSLPDEKEETDGDMGESHIYNEEEEFRRIGALKENSHLRIYRQDINNESICKSYPRSVLVPKTMCNDEIIEASKFRSRSRFPTVTWMHPENGAVLCRCSQPLAGIRNIRNEKDEELVRKLVLHENSKEDSDNNEKNQSNSEASSIIKSVSGSMTTVWKWALNPTEGIEDNYPRSKSAPPAISSHVIPKHEVNEYRNDFEYYIIDARSRFAVFGNRAIGKGTENIDNYKNAKMLFMNIDNVHVVRACFNKLYNLCIPRNVCKDDDMYNRNLADTGWLKQVRNVLSSSITIVNIIHKKGMSVVTHCSDGWDRTSQMVSLSCLMMDPYYRTIKGFALLIEKEWISFGHKFKDRCGHRFSIDSPSNFFHFQESSPVFLLWMNCVYQVMIQFPNSFQFNEKYLIAICDHVYNCHFSNFMLNSSFGDNSYQGPLVRLTGPNVPQNQSQYLWKYLEKQGDFLNLSYNTNTPNNNVLYPSCHPKSIILWKSYFFRYDSSIPPTIYIPTYI